MCTCVCAHTFSDSSELSRLWFRMTPVPDLILVYFYTSACVSPSEFPTFVMALGRLGIYRHDILFGSSFFVTRIGIHFINLARQVATFDGKGVPRKYEFLCWLSLGLHVHWFYAWCVGQRKRMLRARKAKEE